MHSEKNVLKRLFKQVNYIVLLILLSSIHLYSYPNRGYEPYIINGSQLPAFLNASTGSIVFYNYNAVSKTWTRIPSQIDERDDNGKYIFSGQDNLLTSRDELLFLTKDCRDMAPSNLWLSDVSTKNYQRYEIKVTDPVYNSTGYVYVFRTNTPGIHPAMVDYISFNSTTDIVTSQFYEMAHDSQHGFMTNAKIFAAAGGTGIDILDRLKLRIKGNVNISGLGNISISLTENDIEKDGTPPFIDGNIRVIRNWKFKIKVSAFGLTTRMGPYDFLFKFYPNISDFGNERIKLPDGASLDLVRYSFDLNANANGMRMFTPKAFTVFPDGALINRTDDFGLPLELDLPGWNWWMQTGTPGTLLTLGNLPLVGSRQSLYYKDGATGTGDGTSDTGESGSWGDTGVIYQNNINPTEGINLGAKIIFLGPSIPKDSAEVYRTWEKNPLTSQVNGLAFDNVAPGAVANLQVTDRSDNSITISWNAPGDDGQTGNPADHYILKCSTSNPGSMLNYWWNNTSAKTGLPAPAAPGTTQSFTITGLLKDKTYYCVMRAVDDFGNESALSIVTSGKTLPVELALFTVNQDKDKVILNWSTKSEMNNAGFTVERKTENSDMWVQVAFVQGAGTTVTERNYTYIDVAETSGLLVYRLKQTDNDGNYTYSPEKTLTITKPDLYMLAQNYPNPFNPSTVIEFQIADNNGKMELAIFDLLGRKIKTLIYQDAVAGYYKVEWDGTDNSGMQSASGTYFYVLTAADFKAIHKMIKLK